MVIIVLILRKPLSNLLTVLNRVKIKDIEFNFGKNLEKAEEDAYKFLPPLPFPEKDELSIIQNTEGRIFDLINHSPRAAIMEASIILESVILDKAIENNLIEKGERTTARRALKLLGQAEITSTETFRLFHSLNKLRNEAAHRVDFEPSKEQTETFVELTLNLAKQVRNAPSKLPRRALEKSF